MFKRLLVVLIVLTVAWHGYREYRMQAALEQALHHVEQRRAKGVTPPTPPPEWRPPAIRDAAAPTNRCDGRTHCSHMTSCVEARYFLQHCPGTQMDGDRDGVPCEQQWCR